MKSHTVNVVTINSLFPADQASAVAKAIDKVILDAWIEAAPAEGKRCMIFEARFDIRQNVVDTLTESKSDGWKRYWKDCGWWWAALLSVLTMKLLAMP